MQFLSALVWYRKAHGLSQAALAAELGVTQQTLSKWESGLLVPSAGVRSALQGRLAPYSAGTRAFWTARVNLSRGRDALLDADLTILAASPLFRDRYRPLMDEIVGRSINDLIPEAPAESSQDTGGDAVRFPRINELGFFTGSVRSIHWKAEFHYDAFCVGLINDCWPIVTSDGEILAHLVGYRWGDLAPVPGFTGVKVHWFDVVLNRSETSGATDGPAP